MKELIAASLLQRLDYSVRLQKLIDSLPLFDQKTFILSALRLISKEYLSSIVTSEDDSDWWHADETLVSAAAGLLNLILGKEEFRKTQIISWLTGASGAGVGDGIAIRRAAIAALEAEKSDMETVLEKSLQQFGDQLYIRHTPTMQQEGIFSQLLLSVSMINYLSSACSSSSSVGWPCPPKVPPQTRNDDEVRSTSQRGVKQARCIITTSSISRYGYRRSFIRSCRQRRQEDELQDGGDEHSRS